MAVKYRITYRAHDDIAWNIDISNRSYTGEVITLAKGVSGNACTITYSGGVDDPYEPLVHSKANIKIYNQGQIDILELQEAQDRDFVVEVFRSGELYWKGFVIPDGITQTFQSPPYDVTISATDGLSLLEGIPYTGLLGSPMPDGSGQKSPLAFFRNVFSDVTPTETLLGNNLPIRWVNGLECTAFPGIDVMAGSVKWSMRDEAQKDSQGNIQNSLYILEEILRSFQSRIYQAGGRWNIERINEVASGAYTWKEVGAVTGDYPVPVTTGSVDGPKSLGRDGYRFINEDQIFTVKQGLKSVKVTYAPTVRENVLPNGNQDIALGELTIPPTPFKPLYWNLTGGDTGYVSVNSIVKQRGKATEIENTMQVQRSFAMNDSINPVTAYLPIDTTTLYRRMSFGFTILPQSGFAVNTDGIITAPVRVWIRLVVGTTFYTLTEFGTWSEVLIDPIPIYLNNAKINDVVQVDFNRNQEILLPASPVPLAPGVRSDLTVQFRVDPGQKYTLDNIYIKVDQNNDIYESSLSGSSNTDTEEVELKISSSFTGFHLSNYMTTWSRSDEESFFKDGDFYTGTLTGLTANAMMRFRHKSSLIFNGSINVRNKNWTFGEIYEIQTLTDRKFLPLNASYNTETAEVNGLVAIECRNDAITLTEKHYGSNDEMLSN